MTYSCRRLYPLGSTSVPLSSAQHTCAPNLVRDALFDGEGDGIVVILHHSLGRCGRRRGKKLPLARGGSRTVVLQHGDDIARLEFELGGERRGDVFGHRLTIPRDSWRRERKGAGTGGKNVSNPRTGYPRVGGKGQKPNRRVEIERRAKTTIERRDAAASPAETDGSRLTYRPSDETSVSPSEAPRRRRRRRSTSSSSAPARVPRPERRVARTNISKTRERTIRDRYSTRLSASRCSIPNLCRGEKKTRRYFSSPVPPASREGRRRLDGRIPRRRRGADVHRRKPRKGSAMDVCDASTSKMAFAGDDGQPSRAASLASSERETPQKQRPRSEQIRTRPRRAPLFIARDRGEGLWCVRCVTGAGGLGRAGLWRRPPGSIREGLPHALLRVLH